MQRKQSKPKADSRKILLEEMSMKEAEAAAMADKVVILPIGSVEEHGDHLPLCTDSLQPEYVAIEAARKAKCIVAPTIKYGVCGATHYFPGTISVEFDSLRTLVFDIMKELIRNGFSRILILSGHAGRAHMTALRLAAREVLEYYNKNANYGHSCRIMVCCDYDLAGELRNEDFDKNDSHAGAIETSRIMAIRPDLVKEGGKKGCSTLHRFEVVPDEKRYFPTGVIGDPGKASADKGKKLNNFIIEQVVMLITELKH